MREATNGSCTSGVDSAVIGGSYVGAVGTPLMEIIVSLYIYT